MTTLGGITPHFGSKRAIAPQIVAHFGKHEIYYELFGGSLSVLLAKTPCRNEVVSEKHPDVANLIRCLRHTDYAAALWRQAECHPVSESLFAAAVERLSRPPCVDDLIVDISRAFDFLLVSWQGPSGLAGTTRKPRFAVRNTTSGGSLAARWRAVAPSIPEWHERLRNVEFRSRDAFELVKVIPDREGVVVYSDSPYLSDSRTGGEYAFDFTPSDHTRLRDALARFTKAKVVVSLYNSPDSNRLYEGWHKVPLAAPRTMKHTTGGSHERVEAGEVLFINRV